MSHILVAYFSASGRTARTAGTLAQAAGAELVEIVPAAPYTPADLNWNDRTSRSSVEMKDPASRPAMAAVPSIPADCRVVFVGFPIWWYTAPHIVLSFLEAVDLKDKTVIPFATSGGSPMGRTLRDLKQVCPQARWLEGRVFKPGVSERECAAWLAELGVQGTDLARHRQSR